MIGLSMPRPEAAVDLGRLGERDASMRFVVFSCKIRQWNDDRTSRIDDINFRRAYNVKE